MERLNGILTLIAWRLFLFTILVGILSFTYPVTSRWTPEWHATLAISGFAQREEVILERLGGLSEGRRAVAGEDGIALFDNIPFGQWRVVQGGSAELRKLIIPVDEYRGDFSYGSIRVVVKKKSRDRRYGYDHHPGV